MRHCSKVELVQPSGFLAANIKCGWCLGPGVVPSINPFRHLRKKSYDRLKAHLLNIASSFEDKKVVPLHHLVSASSTNIRG